MPTARQESTWPSSGNQHRGTLRGTARWADASAAENGQRTTLSTLNNAICNGHPADAGGEDLSPAAITSASCGRCRSPKLTVLQQVVLLSPLRRVVQVLIEAGGWACVPPLSARHKEEASMTDKISQRPIPPLDPPEQFAGGEVVAAARCPVDVSTLPRRHVIVVKHVGERQTFSVHEVAHNHVEWVSGPGMTAYDTHLVCGHIMCRSARSGS